MESVIIVNAHLPRAGKPHLTLLMYTYIVRAGKPHVTLLMHIYHAQENHT